MNIILSIIIAGVLIYLIVKFCLLIYRPFFLSKTFRNIDEMYNRVLNHTERSIHSALEDLKEWEAGDKVIRLVHSEDRITKNVNDAESAKAHEEEVYAKFLRLKEHFIHHPTKLAEAIAAYQRYLKVRLAQFQGASIYSSGVTSGAITFDELVKYRNEIIIILKENERKLDMLLTD